MKTKFLLYILVVFACSSCYKELDMEKYRPTPKLVLNCGLSPDSVIKASVTRTWFYLEEHPNITLKDVKVDIYLNGEHKEQMWWEDNEEAGRDYNAEGIYMSSVIPKPGDHIKIIASGEYGTVTAEDIIPHTANLEKIDISYMDYNDIYGKLLYKITIKDPGETNDYYLIKIIQDHYPSYSYSWIEWENEPILRPNQSALDDILGDNWINGYKGAVFSDELINGKEYTLNITEYWYKNSFSSGYYPPLYPDDEETPPEPYAHRNIYLYKISEPYYRYLIILQNYWSGIQYDLADLGLAEPIRVYSNVEGGTGILGSYNAGVGVTFDLKEILPDDLIIWGH